MELWSGKNGKLISKEGWEQQIDQLKRQLRSSLKDTAMHNQKERCAAEIAEALASAVQQRVPNHRYGIFLSGGVDSSLLTVYAEKTDIICYTVGYKGATEARDVTASRALVKKYNLLWKLKLLTLAEVEKYIEHALEILKPVNLIDSVSIGIAVVIIAAAEEAQKDNITAFLGGLGAEEIFAGYKRHIEISKASVKTSSVNEECWRGLRAMWTRDLVRDAALAQALSISVRTPFLDEEVIKAAMRCPEKWKIVNGERKVILREIAEAAGVPKEIAWRSKQAAQYGSGIDKAIAKLTKMHGYSDKGAYLKSICE